MVGHPRHEERNTGVACSCLGYGKQPGHKKHDPVVAFFVSGWYLVVGRVSSKWKLGINCTLRFHSESTRNLIGSKQF